MGEIKIKLAKSLIGGNTNQIAVAHSLGLKKIGDETTQPNNLQTKGKINKITHLVNVEKN
ncbi:MAG: 50S ribosomal protein L30 [Oscillospiraceae bacterium]|nr:50S ribosomal protein L30 [Oscillospiraceae bacterium]